MYIYILCINIFIYFNIPNFVSMDINISQPSRFSIEKS